jgi:hypothetical protein
VRGFFPWRESQPSIWSWQLGSLDTIQSHSVLASDPAYTSAIAVEIIGNFTLNSPPKQPQLSGS